MLLQSAHGYINILPALPAVWNKTGKVTGMKAMGNFVVDFNWADGKCLSAKIVSNAGAELKVRCTRGAMALDKARVTVDGKEVGVTVDKHGIATIPCAKDAVVEIDFTTETAIKAVAVEGAKNGAIYDIQGRRVNEVASNQVYIQDGVKRVSK
jgi:alpha-L-fucosidase 2